MENAFSLFKHIRNIYAFGPSITNIGLVKVDMLKLTLYKLEVDQAMTVYCICKS